MTTITNLPSPPTTNDPVSFAQRADAFFAALPNFGEELNLIVGEVNTSTIIAQVAATSAAASASAVGMATNTTQWVSGTTYSIGQLVWSPITLQTFRRKTSGAGTTDPSLDTTNWVRITGGGDVLLTEAQTLTNKTLTNPTLVGALERAVVLSGTGTITISPATGANSASVYRYTCTGNTTFSLSTSGAVTNQVVSFILELVNPGAFTITWPSAVKWSLGNTPVLTVTGTDILGFYTYDQGTTWRASVIARDSK